MKKNIIAAILVSGLFSACYEVEIGKSKDIEANAIAQDFEIKYTENDENFELTTKFRVSGVAGTTLVLNQPSKVEVNNMEGKLDSSKYKGAFYIWNFPSSGGKYNIVYTDKNNKTLSNSFNFNGFKLLKDLPETINQGNDLELHISGIENNKKVSVVLDDTSSNHGDVMLDLTVINNKAVIAKADLQKLSKGPIDIQVNYNYNEKLKEVTNEEGRLHYNYSLRRRSFKLQ